MSSLCGCNVQGIHVNHLPCPLSVAVMCSGYPCEPPPMSSHCGSMWYSSPSIRPVSGYDRYRLSSGAGDTSSSEGEDERYDHMEANIFKTSDTQEVNKRLSDKNLRSDGALVSVVEKEEEEKDPYEASTDEEMDRSEGERGEGLLIITVLC